ncbi:hypothetical protein QUF95_30965 [Paenibacillus silvae]|uniref:hypothetical protein n=1 Tax=Paenibacillus silvae TaxID=1325358 RepID=UPI0025A1A187|nr:hypothetical protein [Paenibacillus silvae]MDM5281761.1 hypothetical protein [Paenibacillus silvae]
MIDIKYFWQMSKYKEDELPLYQQGKKETWTSVSDIGKVIYGEKVTVSDYLNVEDSFVEGIKAFMTCTKSTQLTIKQLEKPLQIEVIKADVIQKGFSSDYNNTMFNLYQLLERGTKVNFDEIEHLIRLALREYIWVQLESDSMFVRFDYDYYVDIGAVVRCDEAVQQVRAIGLSINLWEEPYPFYSSIQE